MPGVTVKGHQSAGDDIGVLNVTILSTTKGLNTTLCIKDVLVLLVTTSVGCLRLRITGKIRSAYVNAGVLPMR